MFQVLLVYHCGIYIHPYSSSSELVSELDVLADKQFTNYKTLSEPNNDSPLNVEAAQLWNNKVDYKQRLMANYNADAKLSK